jgi:hypothetical protein
VQDVPIGCRLQLREHASWNDSRVEGETPLSLFAVGNIAAEHVDRVLVEIDTEAERVMGALG